MTKSSSDIKWFVSSAASYAQILRIFVNNITIFHVYVPAANIMSLPSDTVQLLKYIL